MSIRFLRGAKPGDLPVQLPVKYEKLLLTEACARLSGFSKLTRDEMRLAGYPDDMPEIDVCE
jgi:hypothetical protein